ncbi:MAG: hypothetical protein V2I33_08595, partial [Kangiellaceae bacterium]|nr:hypothetical protein [Kangiellaceae bacterium]
KRIKDAASRSSRDRNNRDSKKSRYAIRYVPSEEKFPDSLRQYHAEKTSYAEQPSALAVAIDLDNDGEDEYLFINTTTSSNYYYGRNAQLHYLDKKGEWTSRSVKMSLPDNSDIEYQLDQFGLELKDPKYQDLHIGKIRISLN